MKVQEDSSCVKFRDQSERYHTKSLILFVHQWSITHFISSRLIIGFHVSWRDNMILQSQQLWSSWSYFLRLNLFHVHQCQILFHSLCEFHMKDIIIHWISNIFIHLLFIWPSKCNYAANTVRTLFMRTRLYVYISWAIWDFAHNFTSFYSYVLR